MALIGAALQPTHAFAQAPAACPVGTIPFEEFVTDSAVIVDSNYLNSYKVPSVAERPLNPDDGEKILVRRFVVEGWTENVANGITDSALQELVDAAQKRSADAEGVAPLTVGQMAKVSDEVTTFYRSRGYIVARAFVPVQDVSDDGVVRIQVLEGKVGEVLAEGNKRYGTYTLVRPSRSLIGGIPTRDAVESALLYTQDYPGLRVFGTFRPGAKPGETNLVLQVQEEKRFDFSLGSDNYGIELTGVYRLRGDATWNSPLGAGDRLNVSLVQSISPSNTAFGSGEYRVPFLVPGMTLATAAGLNEFRVNQGAFAALDLQGTLFNTQSSLDWKFYRSRFLNAGAKLGYSRKQSKLKAATGFQVSDDSLNVLAFEGGFDRVDTVFRGLDIGSLRFRKGFDSVFVGVNNGVLQPDFTVFDLSYTRVQPLFETQTLVGRLRYQKAPQQLSSLEQFSLSGPDAVRAYPVGDVLRDTARFASLEYRVQAPFFASVAGPFGRRWGDLFQIWFFGDYAQGESESAAPSVIEISGYGSTLQFSVPGSFQFTVHGSQAISKVVASDKKRFRVFGELSYRF